MNNIEKDNKMTLDKLIEVTKEAAKKEKADKSGGLGTNRVDYIVKAKKKSVLRFTQEELNLISDAIITAQKALSEASKVLSGKASEEVQKQLTDLANLNTKVCSYLK